MSLIWCIYLKFTSKSWKHEASFPKILSYLLEPFILLKIISIYDYLLFLIGTLFRWSDSSLSSSSLAIAESFVANSLMRVVVFVEVNRRGSWFSC